MSSCPVSPLCCPLTPGCPPSGCHLGKVRQSPEPQVFRTNTLPFLAAWTLPFRFIPVSPTWSSCREAPSQPLTGPPSPGRKSPCLHKHPWPLLILPAGDRSRIPETDSQRCVRGDTHLDLQSHLELQVHTVSAPKSVRTGLQGRRGLKQQRGRCRSHTGTPRVGPLMVQAAGKPRGQCWSWRRKPRTCPRDRTSHPLWLRAHWSEAVMWGGPRKCLPASS